MTDDQWYVLLNGERLGPLRADEITSRLKARALDPRSLAWSPGLTTWQPLTAIAVFASWASQPPVSLSNARIGGGLLRKSALGCLAILAVCVLGGLYLLRDQPTSTTPTSDQHTATKTSDLIAPALDLSPLTVEGTRAARLRGLTHIQRLGVIAFADSKATDLTGLIDHDLSERVRSRLSREGLTVLSYDALQREPGRPAIVVDIVQAEKTDITGNIADGAVIMGFSFKQDLTRVNNPREAPIWGKTWTEPDMLINYKGTLTQSALASDLLPVLDRFVNDFLADIATVRHAQN